MTEKIEETQDIKNTNSELTPRNVIGDSIQYIRTVATSIISKLNQIIVGSSSNEETLINNSRLMDRRQFITLGGFGVLLAACGEQADQSSQRSKPNPSSPQNSEINTTSPEKLVGPVINILENKIVEITGGSTSIEYLGFNDAEKESIQKDGALILDFLAKKAAEAGVSKNIWNIPPKITFTRSQGSSSAERFPDGSMVISLDSNQPADQLYHLANEFFTTFIAMRADELNDPDNEHFIIGDSFSTIFSLEFEKQYPSKIENSLTKQIERSRKYSSIITNEDYSRVVAYYGLLSSNMKSPTMIFAFENLNWKIALGLVDSGFDLKAVMKFLDSDGSPSQSPEILAALQKLGTNYWNPQVGGMESQKNIDQVIFSIGNSNGNPILSTLTYSYLGPIIETNVQVLDANGKPISIGTMQTEDGLNIQLPIGLKGIYTIVTGNGSREQINLN